MCTVPRIWRSGREEKGRRELPLAVDYVGCCCCHRHRRPLLSRTFKNCTAVVTFSYVTPVFYLCTALSGAQRHQHTTFSRLDHRRILLLGLLDVVEGLGVSGGLEDIVELLLHYGPFLEGPARVLLVAEHHVLQDSLRHAQTQRDLCGEWAEAWKKKKIAPRKAQGEHTPERNVVLDRPPVRPE